MQLMHIILLVIPFLMGYIMYPFFIRGVIALNWKQTVREEGPSTHISKQGTPIMGGLVFLIVILIMLLLLSVWDNQHIKSIVFLMVAITTFGLLGFIDDYMITKFQKNDGIKGRYKFIIQLIMSAGLYVLYLSLGLPTQIEVFDYTIDQQLLYGLLFVLMFVSTTNAVNITDGLDGLVSGLTIIFYIGVFMISVFITPIEHISMISVIIVGAICSFMVFNRNPAKIFMGDTGSLAIGAMMVATVILMKQELILLTMGAVFLFETISVILQVGYFKISKGKRLFRMSPIHHHFELGGMSEKAVVYLFWGFGTVFTIISVLISYL